jgi:predicted amidohydrolase
MRVTSIQLARNDKKKKEAIAEVMTLLETVPASDLLILPEIWATGFFSFHRYESESETLEGPTVDLFRKKAVELGCHILLGSLVERDGGRLYNTSILVDPRGDVLATYRKIHLFGYRSRERELLTPGKEIVVVNTPWGKAGLATCYDLRFPELFRKMVERGAKFFLIASAWPQVRLDAWVLFNRARAHENLAYLISCNCAGIDAGSRYAGHSMIVDPLGKVISEGGDQEEWVSAEIDPDLVDSVRRDFSALHDRVIF